MDWAPLRVTQLMRDVPAAHRMTEDTICNWSCLQSGSRCNHQGDPCPSQGAEIPLRREWKCAHDDPVHKVHRCLAERGWPATPISYRERESWTVLWYFLLWLLHVGFCTSKKTLLLFGLDFPYRHQKPVRLFPEDHVSYTVKKYLLSCLFAVVVWW